MEIRDRYVCSLFSGHVASLFHCILSAMHATSLGFEEWSCRRCERAAGCRRCRKRSYSFCSLLHLTIIFYYFVSLHCQENTPLHWASRKGHANVVKLLLDAGAAVNTRDQYVRSYHCIWSCCVTFSLYFLRKARHFTRLRCRVMRML